ncbi:DnaB-like helicase C-terminal domain-containing protein, partial [Limosilactobacillus mucosae]|nr:DnaB-like helicase C-terminal domain-containing protein [Limosilactobacillus mucosae]
VMHHEINDLDIPKINNAGEFIRNLPIYINDKSAISINYLRTVCNERMRKYGLDMIIVDYLQIMRPNEVIRGQSEERI